ncbi:MAG: hypothetical protein V2B15_14320 [Bacteroidota bacterium]
MRTPTKCAFLFLLLFLHSGIYGQNERWNLPEELTLLLDNEVKMVIESNEILKIPTDKEQDTIFRNLLADINKVQDSLSRLSVPLTIYYYIIDENNRKLEVVANSGTKAEFIFNGNSGTIVSGFHNYAIECNLGKNNRLILYTNELSELSSLNDIAFTEIVQQAQSDISVRKIPARKAKTCSYKLENNTIDQASADILNRGMPVISPGAGFGISYIYDRFLANVSASVGYVFAPKTGKRKTLGISFECFANIDPSEAYNVQYNYFADVFFGAKQPYNSFYFLRDIKVFIGYLINCEGDVFQKNTLRWGLEMPAGKNFRIVCVGYHLNLQKGNEGLFEVGIRYKIF